MDRQIRSSSFKKQINSQEPLQSRLLAQQQCDQIGRFLKVLVNKFAYKSIPKILVVLGHSEIDQNYVKKTAVDLGNFWKHLGKIFAPTSSLTAQQQQ